VTAAETVLNRRAPDLGDGRRRVVEIASGVAGAYAGMYLAASGFEVIRVLDPALDMAPEYGDVGELSRAFLHSGKREAGSAALLDLIADAHLVIEQLTPQQRRSLGDGYAGALAARSDLVVVSITPFGRTGPMAETAATELITDAAGGWLQQIGEPERGPIRPPGHQSEVMGGLAAVSAGISALLAAEDTGAGELVDLSLRECVTWFQMNPTTVYAYSGSLGHRTGGASDVNYPQGIFACRDGLIGINVLYFVEWPRFCELLGHPEWTSDPRLETPLLRYLNREVIDEVLLPWLATHTADEIYATGQARRLPFGKVNSPAELVQSAQLRARNYWQRVTVADREALLPSLPAVFT
jgi:crotonobetainyl-CoA:carnitine CoA-transferase CaiB-like acyl-CoA transferase